MRPRRLGVVVGHRCARGPRVFGTRSDMRLWRANVGAARFGRHVVKFGIPGQADLTGILPGGIRLEIEVKGPTGRQSPQQRAF
ncbi:MAG: hypothetical protein D6729_08280 [Deltaproteobacteria bacterium]|nr:MAG: hypothetical protein D6729_08280 [Deltaproteobacteria bacterium]